MSRGQMLRALVSDCLAAAAQDIFKLFERTIMEYEEELCQSKEENQRKQKLLDDMNVTSSSPSPGLNITETWQIKKEQCVKQEEEQLPVCIPKLIAVSVETEEETKKSIGSEIEGHMEHSSDTDDDEDWEPPFSCSSAQMETGTGGERSTELAAPVATVLSDHRKKHQCPVCRKTFCTKQILNRHIRIHTGERPFSCPVCGKTFSQQSHLLGHRGTHAGEKPYSCSICGKSFTRKGKLKGHYRVHTGERPFSCSVCKATFSAKGTLDRHSRIHTGAKPYSCSICHQTFTRKSHVDKHRRRKHTTEKPYSCTVCDKAFSDKSNLSVHLSVHKRHNIHQDLNP